VVLPTCRAPLTTTTGNAAMSFLSLSVTPRSRYIPCVLMTTSSFCKVFHERIVPFPADWPSATQGVGGGLISQSAPMSMATASNGGMRASPLPPNVPATIQPCSARLSTSMVRAAGSTNQSQGTPC